jgi:hypothetical protein
MVKVTKAICGKVWNRIEAELGNLANSFDGMFNWMSWKASDKDACGV